MSQIDTENDKNLKIFKFSKIVCIFSKVSTDNVNRNIEMGQQGKNVLSNMLRAEIKAVIKRKLSGIDIEKDNISKTFDFHSFC